MTCDFNSGKSIFHFTGLMTVKVLMSGPILERKDIGAIFQIKDKIFENLGKNMPWM